MVAKDLGCFFVSPKRKLEDMEPVSVLPLENSRGGKTVLITKFSGDLFKK